jgi:hypothetical protein
MARANLASMSIDVRMKAGVGQPVVTPARRAINEKIATAVPAYVTERDGFKDIAVARGHHARVRRLVTKSAYRHCY